MEMMFLMHVTNPEALNYPFGGLNIVFCGDFSQLNPVGKRMLFMINQGMHYGV